MQQEKPASELKIEAPVQCQRLKEDLYTDLNMHGARERLGLKNGEMPPQFELEIQWAEFGGGIDWRKKFGPTA